MKRNQIRITRLTRVIFVLTLTLILALAFTACGKDGEKSDPTTAADTTAEATSGEATTYVVTFSVNGVETKVTVAPGETPAYTGNTEWEDSEHFYRLLGWDKEFVPATSDATYTAEVGVYGLELVEVFWDTRDGLIRTNARIGETPIPPTINETYETDAAIFTFTGEWNPAPRPITKSRETFTAQYTSVTKQYQITFKLNGETVAQPMVDYGTIPTAPDVTVPTGFTSISWGTFTSVKENATYEGRAVNVDPDVFAVAVDAIKSSNMKNSASAAVFIALEEQKTPGAYADLVLGYLRWLVSGGHEPDFDFSPNFYHPMCSAAVALAKHLDSVWSQLTPVEIEKLDLLMKCMAVQAAQATDAECSYQSGPGFNGNYKKSWNPNYPISNVTQIIFATDYLGGADATNQVLAEFDYDTYIAKFKEWGWTNVLSVWERPINEDGTISYLTASEGTLKEIRKATIITDDGAGHYTLRIVTSSEDVAAQTYAKADWGLVDGEERIIQYTSPKAMMMTGGEIFAMKALYRVSQYVGKSCGTGLSVPEIGQKGYSYGGHTLSDLEGIWNSLLDYNYSGGVVTSKAVPSGDEYLCYIYDGTSSPVEGLKGMMKEFNSGSRSSVSYCTHDFDMVAPTTAVMEALGLYDPMSSSNYYRTKMIWVGNVDFLYKAEHGYVSYTGTAVRGDPKPSYGSGVAYTLFSYLWKTNSMPAFTLDDYEFPKPSLNIVETETLEYAKPVSSTNDLTLTLSKESKSAIGSSHYWEKDLFLSFSLNYDEETIPSFELRLRSRFFNSVNSCRGAFFKYSEGSLTPTGGSPIGDAPSSISIGEYGWHRITIRYHQDATAVDLTQMVTYSITMTVYLDGFEVGSYSFDGDSFKNKGWLLYGATYDATAPDHLVYTDETPQPDNSAVTTWTETTINNPFFQIYRGKVYNNPENIWFLLLGDITVYAGTAPEANIAPVSYELNGGAFNFEERAINAENGYQTEFLCSEVTHYVNTKTAKTGTPEKDGWEFAGWYTDPSLSGDGSETVTIGDDGAARIYYAAWKLPEEQQEIPED